MQISLNFELEKMEKEHKERMDELSAYDRELNKAIESKDIKQMSKIFCELSDTYTRQNTVPPTPIRKSGINMDSFKRKKEVR